MYLAFINIINILVLFVSYYLFSKVAGSMSLRKLNMISFIFYVDIVLLTYIGSTLIINNIDNHYAINKLRSENFRFYGWAALMYAMIALPLGMRISQILFSSQKAKTLYDNYLNKKIVPLMSLHDNSLRMFLYTLSIISILVSIYTFFTIGKIPILSILSDSPEKLAQLRISVSRDFSGNTYLKNIFGLQLSPILTFIAFAYYKLTRRSTDKLWFITMFISTFLILSYNLAKTPFLFFLSGFIFFKVIQEGEIKLKTFFRFSLLIFSLIITAYIVLSNATITGVLSSYNTGILGRIFLSQNAGLYASFDIFPLKHDFLHFSSFSGFVSRLFGLEGSPRSARIIMELINPESIKNGTGGVVNSFFIGEAWANWGILGVLISPFLVGGIIGFLFTILMRLSKTPIYMGILVYFSYHSSITGGVNDFIYNAGNLIIFSLIFIILISSKGIFETFSK